ncbi:MAG TPA: nuclear transport factor 2 family protein [Gemmatimonadaceae bacterium]|nr:nuclear transport factor 2 family protein [Gemmatimonadaceae bacterium]
MRPIFLPEVEQSPARGNYAGPLSGMRGAVALVLLAVVATSAPAQRPGRDSRSTPVARALIALEDGWARGVVRRDTAMFRRLLHPRFVYTEDATVMTADEVIASIRDGDRVDRATNADMVVHEHGGTAVVTGILRLEGRGKDGAFDRRYRFTDTWLRTGGRWRIIAAQDYLIPR